MKFCANISFMFTEASSILERYALAKEAGFKAVEGAFPAGFSLEQVKQAKERAGIEQVLVNIKIDDFKNGPAIQPGKEKQFQEDLKTTIDYAKALNIKKIHIVAGILPNPTASNWETYENNLKYAAEELKKENILGVIEPINQYSVPNYFLSDYNKAIDIIKRINNTNLKLQLDVFHMQQICGDLSHNIKNLMPYVGHVQIAQVPKRNEPDTPGEVNYRYILEELSAAGYADWVGLEYAPAGDSRAGLHWVHQYGYSL